MKKGLITAVILVLIDQWTKHMMLERLFETGRQMDVFSFLTLTPVWNRGISFGLLPAGSPLGVYLLVAVALIIIIIMGRWLRQATTSSAQLAIGLIIGAASGNIIDRIRHHAVVDFFDFHYGPYHWPAFNIADVAITLGVMLIIFDHFTNRSESGTTTS